MVKWYDHHIRNWNINAIFISSANMTLSRGLGNFHNILMPLGEIMTFDV